MMAPVTSVTARGSGMAACALAAAAAPDEPAEDVEAVVSDWAASDDPAGTPPNRALVLPDDSQPASHTRHAAAIIVRDTPKLINVLPAHLHAPTDR